MTELLRQTASLGAGSPIKAIKAAIDGHAEQIILVGGQRLDPQDLGELKELIKGASHLKRFDVVLIDENAAEMSDVADRYISLPLDKLRVWYAAWQQQKQQQKSPGGN